MGGLPVLLLRTPGSASSGSSTVKGPNGRGLGSWCERGSLHSRARARSRMWDVPASGAGTRTPNAGVVAPAGFAERQDLLTALSPGPCQDAGLGEDAGGPRENVVNKLIPSAVSRATWVCAAGTASGALRLGSVAFISRWRLGSGYGEQQNRDPSRAFSGRGPPVLWLVQPIGERPVHGGCSIEVTSKRWSRALISLPPPP